MGSTTSNPPAVRIRGLSKEYRGKPVLSGIDLEIRTGERFCLVGRNGSGKSTLLEIIKGLKVATTGSIEVLGRHPLDQALKSECSMLMDRPVFPYYAKVKEVVWLYSGFYSQPLDGLGLLPVFELSPDTYVRHLSKGQIQRLGLLLTVLGDPKLILLDEPTSGLDPQGRLLLWETLERALEKKPGRTLIFATHDLAEAERRAQRVGVMHAGRLVHVDSAERLCSTVVGTRRKLTLIGACKSEFAEHAGTEIKSTASLGAELALYTDHPEETLRRVNLNNGLTQVRIENVSLRDAYFRLTGEVPDDALTLAN
jgi:ABC-2 type transport system ATP-binding protein